MIKVLEILYGVAFAAVAIAFLLALLADMFYFWVLKYPKK